jgi:hypothetical protein
VLTNLETNLGAERQRITNVTTERDAAITLNQKLNEDIAALK